MTPRHFAVRRTPRWYARPVAAFALGTAVVAAAALPLGAQGAGKGFLFKEPVGSLALRGGLALAGSGGDSSIYAFTRRELTLGRSAFDSPAFGAELSFRLVSRLDLVFGGAYAGTSKRSEFRDWVDQSDQPIEQTTSLQRVPLTVGLKAYLTPRGHTVGNFAWLPNRYAPYVGAGVGTMWYRFRQQGDFVDFNSPTHNVFSTTYESSKWTATEHVMAGIDYSLSPRFALTTEGRYQWAKTDLGSDFSGFDPIDLSGFSATLGLIVRF